VGLSAPGDRLALEVWREGKKVQLTAELAPSTEKVAAASAPGAIDGGRIGLALRPLAPEEKQETGLRSGVVVEDVAGPAEAAGVEPGDVVLAVNGTPVTTPDQVKAAVAKSSKSVALLIQRGDDKIFVPIRIG
jgi:serine protease Do